MARMAYMANMASKHNMITEKHGNHSAHVNSCQDMKMVKVCVTDILNEDDTMKLGDLRQQVQLKLFGKFSCDIRTLNAYVDSTVAHLKRKQGASDPPSKRASPKPVFMRR